MPDFLSMLRQNQTFPLGRPDTGDSGIGNAARQVIPLANSLKDRDMQRQKEMMQFQAAQARRQQLQAMQKPVQYLNPDTPTSGRMNAAPTPQGGFSPMQQFMQGREARDVAHQNAVNMQDARLRSAEGIAGSREAGEMNRAFAELGARRAMNTEDNTTRSTISQNELKARTGETAQERALRLRMNNDDNIAARERTVLSGQNAIDVANSRPSGFSDQYEQQVQDFKINFPDYANRLTFDPDSKRWGVNLDGLTPEQKAVIQRRLTPRNGAPRPPSPSGNTGVRK